MRKLQKKDLGRVTYIFITKPNGKISSPWRWITRQKDDRFYGRSPKIGVFVRDLELFRDEDYGPERIIPADAKIGERKRRHLGVWPKIKIPEPKK